MQKHAQASQEYIYIFSFVVVLVVVTILLAQNVVRDYSQDFTISRANDIARRITDNAEKIAAFGKGTRISVEVVMPKNIDNITLVNDYSGNCDKCTEIRISTTFESEGYSSSSMIINSSSIKAKSREGDVEYLEFYDNASTEGKKTFILESYGSYIDIRQK